MFKNKIKILVVDDEPEFVDMLKMRLEANHYEVITAYDGEDGLKEVKENKPDLILLDIMMPVMDGPTMAEQLRLDPQTKDIPIIFLTCLMQKEEEMKMEGKIKGNLLMAKPFDAKELLVMIQDTIAKKGK